MRVLQIANGYLGADLYQKLFAAEEKLGVQNIVYIPIATNTEVKRKLTEDVTLSRCFTQWDRPLFFRKQAKIRKDVESRFNLAEVDLVHAHTVFSGGYTAYKLHQKYGIPYLVAVRNTDLNTFFRYMVHLRSTGIQILRGAEKIIFLSPAYREALIDRYIPERYREEIRQKSEVIPNGISELFLGNKHKNPPPAEKTARLIYVGDIDKNKNLELTARAAELLREEGMNVTLTAVGRIRNDSYLELLDHQDGIIHYERCPQEEVIQHLNQADIFVMPSHTETFGLVYAEAMSQGLPVLYTRGQGFDGHFPDGTVGYAVSDQDPAELAEKIKLVLKNYEQISANCERCVDRFNWHSIAQGYLQMYQNMLPPVFGAEGETKQ